MILETKLNNLDNKPIKVNKKSPPMSINKDLTPFYFTAMFIGAKNSGKSYGLVKLLKFYENEPIKDADNNTLQIRTILFCPTATNSIGSSYINVHITFYSHDKFNLQFS